MNKIIECVPQLQRKRNQIAQFKRKVFGYGKNQQIKQNIGDSYKKVLDRVNLNRAPQFAQKDSQKRHR